MSRPSRSASVPMSDDAALAALVAGLPEPKSSSTRKKSVAGTVPLEDIVADLAQSNLRLEAELALYQPRAKAYTKVKGLLKEQAASKDRYDKLEDQVVEVFAKVR